MATGTAKGIAVFAGVSPEIIRASAREAEALGYRSFWVNHPGPVDGLGSLGHAAAETRRIDLGVGVIPLHTRGPEAIAEGVRAHGLPPERLLLGVGSPNPEALKRVRDGVAALRAALSTRIIVAALGPKMCHLAGEVAERIRALLRYVAPDKLWLNPDCGFWETPRWATRLKMAALVEGARLVRRELEG